MEYVCKRHGVVEDPTKAINPLCPARCPECNRPVAHGPVDKIDAAERELEQLLPKTPTIREWCKIYRDAGFGRVETFTRGLLSWILSGILDPRSESDKCD